jgi:hypothetical protein
MTTEAKIRLTDAIGAVIAVALVLAISLGVITAIYTRAFPVLSGVLTVIFGLALYAQTCVIGRLERDPKPDYSLIAAMEREVYGETFDHEGAPDRRQGFELSGRPVRYAKPVKTPKSDRPTFEDDRRTMRALAAASRAKAQTAGDLCAACRTPISGLSYRSTLTENRYCPRCHKAGFGHAGWTVTEGRPEPSRCYCNYCQGRSGIHGAEATALYRAEVAAVMSRDERRSNLRREGPS